MNALNVIGTAVNLAFFVLVLAGTLAILDEEGKTSVIQILFCICLEICFALNIFLICTRDKCIYRFQLELSRLS